MRERFWFSASLSVSLSLLCLMVVVAVVVVSGKCEVYVSELAWIGKISYERLPRQEQIR